MSIKKAVIFLRDPREVASSPEAANRITKSEWSAWLMKCLVPLITKSPPDSTAEVFSTYVTPRRPQNAQDVAADRSSSASGTIPWVTPARASCT